MADEEHAAAGAGAAAAAATREVKLPTFWPSRPAAWFRLAESRFRLRDITQEQAMFDHLLSALPEDVIAAVMDVLEEAGDEQPYTILKERLLETHTLSDFEKVEQLLKLPALGGGSPHRC